MSTAEPTDTSYNGWTNYATWGVALVLDNDEGTYTAVHDQLGEFRADAPDCSQVANGIWTEDQAVRFNLADWLKDFTEELCGLGDFEAYGVAEPSPSLMARQVIGAGLANVDWDEIANHYISEG